VPPALPPIRPPTPPPAARPSRPGRRRTARRRRSAAEPRHGGAWKVAYADFVTAMMAFFLLLWLLGVTTTEQRQVIADYFSPAAVSTSESGSGGVLGGLTITVPGALVSSGGPLEMRAGSPGAPAGAVREDGEGGNGTQGAEEGRPPSRPSAQEEERLFAQAEERLMRMVGGLPELAESARSVVVDRAPEGLRIQLLDRADHTMFPLGSARMSGETRQLLGLVAKAVAPLPNRLSISGHTDATRYAGDGAYGNWELSTDRANATRRALVEAGLDEARIATVVGRADRDPLVPGTPDDPRNRRIGIVLLRDHAAPAGQGNRTATPAGDVP
jgi:chemotaxis protein MotB